MSMTVDEANAVITLMQEPAWGFLSEYIRRERMLVIVRHEMSSKESDLKSKGKYEELARMFGDPLGEPKGIDLLAEANSILNEEESKDA